MNLRPPPTIVRIRGLTLIEALVYIAVLLAISAVAFSAVQRLWTATGHISAATDDCASALRAAEQWRRDVRSVRAPVTVEDEGRRCRLEGPDGTIVWSHGLGALWRQVGNRPAALWVARVEVCRFDEDPRQYVKAVRCDLILTPRSVRARQAPVFSFLAVPTSPGTPPR
jgi:Tfp pilus assembly protein FimT